MQAVIKCLAKHNCEGQAVLSTAEEEDHRVQCVDDIKSQVLPWSAVCQALEQELKSIFETLGVYEKVEERDAIATCQVNLVDTKWIDTQSIPGSARTNQATTRGTRVQTWRQARPVCGDSSVRHIESNNLHRSESQANILHHAHRRVTCILSRKGSETGSHASGGQNGCRLVEEGYVWRM